MSSASKEHEVMIDGIICTVTVQQTRKTVWTAHGEFDGKMFHGKGGSAETAKASWQHDVESRDS